VLKFWQILANTPTADVFLSVDVDCHHFQNPVTDVAAFSMAASHGQSSVSSAEPVVPEPITLPDYNEWDMFITCGNSTDEIWCRLIGEEYSVSFCYWFTLGVSVRGEWEMSVYGGHRVNPSEIKNGTNRNRLYISYVPMSCHFPQHYFGKLLTGST
jgi:hypothetical protein